ncbi:hypothetical protein Pint_31986 [Pistacia integerrima]|uniref:Uncharacterized protein n=1 Tax=Pistacia integerrima TaxID=434235 RepID=A0ACC0XR88_9ROSI|nr:hypothetical protein Pint_31986 [Pistacia integerrima]
MSSESESESESVSPRPRSSCIKCFDALWFCYSPVHQMQQYYRLGTFDNCVNKWAALVDCLSLKTKPSSQVENILEAREKEKEKAHIWTFRTPEEATSHWKSLFGHLDE